MENKIIYKDESYNIIGAAMEIHSILGCGYTEPVYQEALEYEFKRRNIPYEREKVFKINYKDITLQKNLRVDFLCYNKIIVEIKAVSGFTDGHYAQIYNYLKATNLKLGILLNFGTTGLQRERIEFHAHANGRSKTYMANNRDYLPY